MQRGIVVVSKPDTYVPTDDETADILEKISEYFLLAWMVESYIFLGIMSYFCGVNAMLPCSAGHGGSIMDSSGDEEDNMDETMIPMDFNVSGQIKDDELFAEVGKSTRFSGFGVVKVVIFNAFVCCFLEIVGVRP